MSEGPRHARFVERGFSCPPESVFAVLATGWLYPCWVVGTARMRAVSPRWPARGATLRHSFGFWPLPLIDDHTTLVVWKPPRRASFMAHGGALGTVAIDIEVHPHDPGCLVRMRERPVRGPAAPLRGLIAAGFRLRNTESLRRLAFLAEGRAGS